MKKLLLSICVFPMSTIFAYAENVADIYMIDTTENSILIDPLAFSHSDNPYIDNSFEQYFTKEDTHHFTDIPVVNNLRNNMIDAAHIGALDSIGMALFASLDNAIAAQEIKDENNAHNDNLNVSQIGMSPIDNVEVIDSNNHFLSLPLNINN